MRRIISLAVLLGSVLLSGCSTLDRYANNSPVPSVAGTIWSGKDSDGDAYEYHFKKSGVLYYKSPTGFWKNASWQQRGKKIYMEMNKKYMERRGTINGRTMRGKAWNVKGQNWTWYANKKLPAMATLAPTKPAPAMPVRKAVIPRWSYAGKTGPAYWGELNRAFVNCSSGRKQSPVNLTAMRKGSLPPLTISYRPGGAEVINTGRTLQVNISPGSSMEIAGKKFVLKQFHFHAPSEHTIEGYSYPIEGHFVHRNQEGQWAVIAVLFKPGANNAELAKAWANLPERVGEKKTVAVQVNPARLLPTNLGYYQYNGSLTTPPCTQGVAWYVMKFYNTLSKQQIEKFSLAIPHPNNRPIMPTNGRTIMQ